MGTSVHRAKRRRRRRRRLLSVAVAVAARNAHVHDASVAQDAIGPVQAVEEESRVVPHAPVHARARVAQRAHGQLGRDRVSREEDVLEEVRALQRRVRGAPRDRCVAVAVVVAVAVDVNLGELARDLVVRERIEDDRDVRLRVDIVDRAQAHGRGDVDRSGHRGRGGGGIAGRSRAGGECDRV
eukprot:30696-Pelagococcus_subviridis.AAC.3